MGLTRLKACGELAWSEITGEKNERCAHRGSAILCPTVFGEPGIAHGTGLESTTSCFGSPAHERAGHTDAAEENHNRNPHRRCLASLAGIVGPRAAEIIGRTISVARRSRGVRTRGSETIVDGSPVQPPGRAPHQSRRTVACSYPATF
jgi:hypothetical protein